MSHVEVVDSGASITAMASIPEHLAIIKMENESLMAMATARPRNHAAILAGIKGQLAAYRSFAQSAIYTKPVGDGKTVRGLSVRAAESLAEAYGYNRVSTSLRPYGDDGSVVVSASFVDYQNGRVWQAESIVSRKYKVARSKGGGMAEHPEDRFYDVVVKAATSKIVREVILRSMPAGLKADLEEAVDEQLDALLDDSTVKKLVAQFSKKGVTVEQIERLCGKKIEALTKDDRRELLGVWNALDQGEITVAEAFPPPESNGVPGAAGLAARIKASSPEPTAQPQPTAVEPPPTDGRPTRDELIGTIGKLRTRANKLGVGKDIQGVGPDSSEDELQAIIDGLTGALNANA